MDLICEKHYGEIQLFRLTPESLKRVYNRNCVKHDMKMQLFRLTWTSRKRVYNENVENTLESDDL
jgi:hypothetical protein